MRALTVRQPWAWAIVHGGKDVENRTRNIAGSYRGPVAIHAGLTFEKDNEASRAHQAAHGTEVSTELGFGAVIGVVDLVDVHVCVGSWSRENQYRRTCCGDSPWAQLDWDPEHGRTDAQIIHLALANPRPLRTPVPARGRLGLWTPDPDLTTRIQEATQ